VSKRWYPFCRAAGRLFAMSLTRNDHPPLDLIPVLACGLLALFGCATRVPPAALAWKDAIPHAAPAGDLNFVTGVGYLKVETDTDLRMIGRDTYYNLRRPYDLYSADGHLLEADVDNRDGRTGEEPVVRPTAPGRYIVASVYGTTYRKVQVEVRSGAVTEVPEALLRDSPPVFAR
jgi:hypothetical protein